MRHSKDHRVAVVTGAGGGLGRSHALELARQGSVVVVNDTGGDVHGAGTDTECADHVVSEIRSLGGTAMPEYSNVSTASGATSLIEATLERFGRIDALVNNAGVLRDRTFAKMTVDDWDTVIGVHLTGSAYCTLAAWSALGESGTGRVVFTSSAAGLYGQFGQANYAAAKIGVVGLVNTLKIEGEKHGVLVNAIAPLARTRMTEPLLPANVAGGLGVEHVSPLVAYLASAACSRSGMVLEVGAGLIGRVRVVETEAMELPGRDDGATIDATLDALDDLPVGSPYASADAALARFTGHAGIRT